jgi:FMN-dependent NADH-azoreductase
MSIHGPFKWGMTFVSIASSTAWSKGGSQHLERQMKKILRISFSPRGHMSESFRLSKKIVDHLLEKEPGAVVVDRDLGNNSLPHVDSSYAVSQGGPTDVSRDGSMALSEELITELERADYVVISTPMHNLTIPSALKAWIDHVVRVRKTFNITSTGKVGTLGGRPVFVAIASGGRFSGERANQPDFLTPYLRAILSMIGFQDLTFFSVQGTGSAADALAATRAVTEQELQAHFSAF